MTWEKDLVPRTWNLGPGTWDMGFGSGTGARVLGSGLGPGTWDLGFCTRDLGPVTLQFGMFLAAIQLSTDRIQLIHCEPCAKMR